MSEYNHEANNSLVNSEFKPAILCENNWSATTEYYEMAIQEIKRLDEELNTARKQVEELNCWLTKANADVHELSGTNETLGQVIRKKDIIIDRVTETLQNAWENEDITDDLVEDLQSWLDIKTTEETDVIITVKWSVKVTHPKGMDLSDISVNIDEPDLDGDDCEFGSIDQYSVEIDED